MKGNGHKVSIRYRTFDQKGKRAIKLRIKPLNEDYGVTTAGILRNKCQQLTPSIIFSLSLGVQYPILIYALSIGITSHIFPTNLHGIIFLKINFIINWAIQDIPYIATLKEGIINY